MGVIKFDHIQARMKFMPTPIEILLNPVTFIILAIYGTLMAWEAFFPGRDLPHVPFWKVRGLLVFFVYFFVSSYLPLFIDPLLAPYQLFNLTSTETWLGALCGILVYEFGVFVWHYSMHRFDILWRTFHQMHHSAERLDTYGAFYFSLLDMAGFTLLVSISFTLVGISPEAITIVLLTVTFFGVFQHANIKTPQWLGYFIQRPESHTMHHARGIHGYNYSDLPLFDILFGTFRNPRHFEHETGFYNGASARVGEMLLFKDVTKPKEKKVEQRNLQEDFQNEKENKAEKELA